MTLVLNCDMELMDLKKDNKGCWVASVFIPDDGYYNCGYFTERRFLYYSKKEVIQKLRNDGIKVKRKFC